jgi:WD40 repeat protein/serine/threonine protein kinase
MTPGAQEQMQKALAGLRLLQRLRSQPVSDVKPSPDAPEIRRPASERASLPWTQLGRFQLRRELGRGGFGLVYLAFDPLLQREVAVKIPRAESLVTPELRERFHREARTAAGLDHPNLVPIFEAGEVGPVCFVVSAYCPGPTLADWLKQQTERVPWREVAGLLRTLADAVHYAHRHGVVHRDLKPANILLQKSLTTEDAEERRGRESADYPLRAAASSAVSDFSPKITDFGLGKHVAEKAASDPTLTPSGTILGTADYMAPEQAGGRKQAIGPAADIYALGAILYELLLGRPPFHGESDVDTLLLVRTQEPVPPRRLRPKLPRDLETICLKCLQKDPAKRYPSAGALADDLRRFLAGRAILARPVGQLERVWRWSRRNPHLAAAHAFTTAALLALVLLALVFSISQRHAAQEITKQFNLAERRSALLALQTGLTRCEQAKIPEGMLWLAQCLEIAAKLPPAGAPDLEWLARANLALWRQELVPLRAMFPDPEGARALAFSPDGRTIFSAGYKGAIQRWDAITGQRLGPPQQQGNMVTSVAVSADGRWFVTGSVGQPTQVWDATTGEPVGSPLAHRESAASVAISPDSRNILIGQVNGEAYLWDTATRKRTRSFSHPATVYAAAFSPDGRTILTGCVDGTVRLWEAATGKAIGLPMQHQDRVWSVAYSPDGHTALTGSDDKTARLWDAATGKPRGPPLVHPAGVCVVAFSPDGRTILTGCLDRLVRLWEVATGKPLGRPLAHPNGIMAAAYSPDGRTILTGGWREPARLWQVVSDRSSVPVLQHPGEVRGVAYSPDGQTVLTGCKDGMGRFWDAATGTLLGPMLHHHGRILAVAYSPDGRTVLTGSFDKTAQLWETATGKPIGPPLTHTLQVNAVAYSPDGNTVLTGSGDGTVRFWEAATGKPLAQSLVHQSAVEALTYSRDGRTILTGDGSNSIHFWEAATGKLLSSPLRHANTVFDVAYSLDGRTIVTGSRDMTAQLWDAGTRQPVSRPLRHQGSIKSVAICPDSRIVLTGSYDGTARLWDAATGKPIGPVLRHEGEVAAVAFSPDGRTVLTGSYDHTARFWPVPPLVTGEAERIRLWIQVITGMELDEEGGIHMLDAAAWSERCRCLNEAGGSPMP